MSDIALFHSAFIEWINSDSVRLGKLWGSIDSLNNRIRLRVHRFTSRLVVSLSPAGVAVAAKWDGECWDLLFDNDLVAVKSAAGKWRCKLCPAPRTQFARIEDLWIDHLFAPLADWIERVLSPARALYLCEKTGATWASLTDGAVIPPHARYAVFDDTDRSGDQHR